ncbi:iron ABC transporter permease [Paenibacillus selenitireducens]|uniref:Iron ABC transporter permease n=1 Tax=Paenibacillus selenitireducens TaxID=1324314 RepID=A0A1T2XKX2_9BACL|nr:iron ABC transporter permease [Paenibacillus selenitireducens]OPA80455.1 iron ABC transporter permease [Paenibacillus selenitireducens]
MNNYQSKRTFVTIVVLSLVLLCSTLLSLSLGSMKIPPMQVMRAVLHINPDPAYEVVVQNLRLPRIVIAILVGASLAIAGAILQGVVRNPLASPDLIGVTGGASVAAVGFITLTAGQFSIQWLPFVAMFGAFIAAGLNYVLAWKNGVTPLRLILIGIAIASAMSALTSFLLLTGPIYLASQALGWITGSIYGTSWTHVLAFLPWVVIFIPLALFYAKNINVQQLGDATAIGLGSRIQKDRLILIAISVILSGAAVGVAGGIGFIGLMAPHLARRLVGPIYGRLLPVSALFGALLLVLADFAARTIFDPLDIPAGIFTAAIGGPFFLYILYRKKKV